jgi:DDE superfamily endonuclease
MRPVIFPYLSYTYEGKASDKSLAELAGYTLPPGSCLYQAKGFQGFFLPGITIVQPKKTPRGGELTPPEQETNRRISSIRIRIEHAIGGVKRFTDRCMQNLTFGSEARARSAPLSRENLSRKCNAQ